MFITKGRLPHSEPKERYRPRKRTREQVLVTEKQGSMAWMLCSVPTHTVTKTAFAVAVGASLRQVDCGIRRLKEKYDLDVEFLPPQDELFLREEYETI
jgi:hypothetical protein